METHRRREPHRMLLSNRWSGSWDCLSGIERSIVSCRVSICREYPAPCLVPDCVLPTVLGFERRDSPDSAAECKHFAFHPSQEQLPSVSQSAERESETVLS